MMNDPKKVNTPAKQNANVKKNLENPSSHDGLDQWNDRLDNNLENEHAGDSIADDNAKEYSAKYGSGDQSDSEA